MEQPKAPSTAVAISNAQIQGVVRTSRPKRGYHRFRNGMLNARPKRRELPIFKWNQRSPLLRLPAEIRTKIFQMALGGTVIQDRKLGMLGWQKIRFVPNASDHKNLFALTRTCRQIYNESQAMRVTENTFEIHEHSYKTQQKDMRRFQHAQIVYLRLVLPEGNFFRFGTPSNRVLEGSKALELRKRFPSLKTVELCLASRNSDYQFDGFQKAVLNDIEPCFKREGFSVKYSTRLITEE